MEMENAKLLRKMEEKIKVTVSYSHFTHHLHDENIEEVEVNALRMSNASMRAETVSTVELR